MEKRYTDKQLNQQENISRQIQNRVYRSREFW